MNHGGGEGLALECLYRSEQGGTAVEWEQSAVGKTRAPFCVQSDEMNMMGQAKHRPSTPSQPTEDVFYGSPGNINGAIRSWFRNQPSGA